MTPNVTDVEAIEETLGRFLLALRANDADAIVGFYTADIGNGTDPPHE